MNRDLEGITMGQYDPLDPELDTEHCYYCEKPNDNGDSVCDACYEKEQRGDFDNDLTEGD